MSTYKRFDEDDVVPGNPTEVTVGLWSGDTGSLASFFTSSTQASASTAGQYYFDVYQVDPTNVSTLPVPEVQFSIAYGNRAGGGAPTLTQDDNATLSTQAVYSQYRNLLLDPNDTQFTFDGSYNSDHIYVINVARSRLKERMDPGNWLLMLSGSNGTRTFIDDSGQTLDPTVGKAGSVFNIVSGNLTGVSGSTIASSQSANFGGFGLFYPSLGIMVLNPNAISESVGFAAGNNFYSASNGPFAASTGSSTQHQYNHAGLYKSIKMGGDFQARSAETISSTNYFVRVRNKDFNYSNNPTFFDETNGNLVLNSFIKDPRVYLTSIGMYNDQNELLAVAKMSRPTLKSFDRELLIRVRLDW
jgi:hypothetical protein